MKTTLYIIIVATVFVFGVVAGLNVSNGRSVDTAKKIGEYYKESLSCKITLKGCEVTCGTVEKELEETRGMFNRCNGFLNHICDSHEDVCKDAVKELNNQ